MVSDEHRVARGAGGPVLVTGANGQLGQRLIERLSRDGVATRAVVRSDAAAAELAKLSLEVAPEIVVLNYSDAAQLTDAAQGCEFAVHFVGILKESARSLYREAHQASSIALAAAADAAGMRRVVYLSILGTDATSENPCLASKGEAERILLDAKTPALILRVGMVLGPGDTTARIVRGEARARILPLAGGGTMRTQPIFSDDVIDAVIAGTVGNPTSTHLDDLTLDLAGPVSLPQREFIERAAALHGKKPWVVPVPLGLLRGITWLAERLISNPPFTRASLEVINADDDIDPKPACDKLGIQLTGLPEILQQCVGPEAPAT
jgi:uncharacterized protein YbjT (DUF2867 family)